MLTRVLPMGFGDDWLRFNGIGENVTWGIYNNERPTQADKESCSNAALGRLAQIRRRSTGTTTAPSPTSSRCWNASMPKRRSRFCAGRTRISQ